MSFRTGRCLYVLTARERPFDLIGRACVRCRHQLRSFGADAREDNLVPGIGIGGASQPRPSHTAWHTGPYQGGSIGLSESISMKAGETGLVEIVIAQGHLHRRVTGHSPVTRR